METLARKRGRPPRDIQVKTRLRELREAMGLSQKQFAAMIDVTQAAFSKAERTGKGLGTEKWLHVSQIVDVDLRTIFTG